MKLVKTLLGIALSAFLVLTGSCPSLAAYFSNTGTVTGNWKGSNKDDTMINQESGTINENMSGMLGSDVLINNGYVMGYIYGSYNNSSGYSGFNTITNNGYAYDGIMGTYNAVSGSRGGDNHIYNTGYVDYIMAGSANIYAGSNGGNNHIFNYGVAYWGVGTLNDGSHSSGGGNYLYNYHVFGYMDGSYNYGNYTSGGGNYLYNYGGVMYDMTGSYNEGYYSSGGENYLYNYAYVGYNIMGTWNIGLGSSGGNNYIYNSGVVDFGDIGILGSLNWSDLSSGGNNIIINTGQAYSIIGSLNYGYRSSGSGNYIYNSGEIYYLYGSFNQGNNTSGGRNIIYNYGNILFEVAGSYNAGSSSSGGTNYIYNHGHVYQFITGSYNEGDGTSGGNNYIMNTGWVLELTGSANLGTDSTGGGNTIVNTGTVYNDIYGSYNYGTNSSGGGNYIYNHGTVQGDIYGSHGDSGGLGNTIYNLGAVGGGIYAGDANDTVAVGVGATVGGAIDGEAGYDIFGFYNMGPFDPAILANYTYQNFEAYGFVGGTSTLVVDWDTGVYDLVVTGGFFNVAKGVTLTAADLTVYGGGVLGGSGTIVGDVTNRGGIAPGSSVGTLTIDGNFINQDGVLLIELGRTGGDLLRVTGTATLNGGYLRTSLSPDVYLGGESWTVLTANNIVGAFDGFISQLNSATLNLSMSTSSTSIGVSLSRKPYADFAGTNNQNVVGSAFDDIVPLAYTRGGYMADLIIAMDFGYNAAQITDTLQAFVPDMYPAYAFAQLESAGLAADAVDSRLNGARQQAREGVVASPDTATASPGVNVWAKAVGARTSLDASQGWPGYDQTLAGLISGADFAINPSLRLGLAVGYTISDMSWDRSSYIGDMKTLHLLAYGGGEWNDFYVQGSAGIAWHEADAQRDIDLASYSGTTQAEPNATSYLAGVKAGYDFHLNSWRLGPLAGLRYIHLDQDDFSELGDLGLNINMNDADSLISTLGVSASGRYDAGGILLLPSLGLSWQHEFEDDPIGLTAWFNDYSDVPMVFSGQERPSERLVLDAGLNAHLAERLSGSLDFSQTWGDGCLASALSLSVQYSF